MPRSFDTGRLERGELHQLRWLLGNLAALLAALATFFLSTEDWPLAALVCLSALAPLFFPSLPARLPRFAHLLVFPVSAAFFCRDLWVGVEWLPALARLALLLLGYRCLVYRSRREELQLLLLGFFLLVAAGIVTVALSFVALLAAFSALALGLLYTIAEEEGSTAAEEGEPKDVSVRSLPPSWAADFRFLPLGRRLLERLRWRLVALGALLFLGTVAVTALLFVAIPRFQLDSSFLPERFFSRKARTGFSDKVRFGSVAEIARDERLALSVDPGTARPLPASLYLRMLVLDEYARDGSFSLSSRSRLELAASERSASLLRGSPGAPSDGASANWTFYLEPGVSRYLPQPGSFSALRLREPAPLQYEPRLRVVALRSEPLALTAYRVEAPQTVALFPDPFFAARLRAARHTAEGRTLGGARLCLELPSSAEEQRVLKEMLERWGLLELRSAEDFSRLACDRLAALHRYSLSPRIPEGAGDPLVRWLASDEPGHCELFAGSFVLLARAASFPARLVVGFRGGSWNDYSKSLSVRNSDAHAWCELWDASVGAWRRVDPTPGAAAAESPSSRGVSPAPVERGWSARLDSLRVAWYRHVVNFDREAQAAVASQARGWAFRSGEWAASRVRTVSAALRDLARGFWTSPGLGKKGRMFACLLAACAGALVLTLALRALRRTRFGARGSAQATRAESGRWLRRLERLTGPEVPPGAELATLRDALLRLRYGDPATWPEPQPVFRRARQFLRKVSAP